MSRVRVGAIGHRNHAARVLELVERSGIAEVAHVFDARRRADHPRATERFEDLLGCDAVLVLSPNATHFEYLARLGGYGGYVFCEKPPVSSAEELDALERLGLDPGRTFFDFNLRFSKLAKAIDRVKRDGAFGELVAASAIVTHGLAFKPSYASSWRAVAELHRNGVAETAAIHWLDLFTTLFGEPTSCAYWPGRLSGVGTATDSCRVVLGFASGATANVVASYASPRRTEAQLVGTNGVVRLRDGLLEVLSPRDTFDLSGRFADPPVVHAEPCDGDALYDDSLATSVATFLDACAAKTPFPKHAFDSALASNRLIFSLEERRLGRGAR